MRILCVPGLLLKGFNLNISHAFENLCAGINRTNEEIRYLEKLTHPVSPANAIGRVSRMDAIGNKMINEQILTRAQTRKVQLETVLNKANTPEFGQYMYCGNAIPIDRILAIPETTLCMCCASR